MPHTATQTLTRDIPAHLLPYVVKQDPSLYTPIDHAGWRFILKVSRAFFKENAHQKYLDGLRETGISADRIPRIEEMDERLRKFNWRAVAVSGFIPPAVFMEYLSLGILPIACDMRQLEHLAYTPAPDIVHEAAGHAPIIADPDYAAYLRNYGEISRKAIFSAEDMEVYYAIRELSDVKEDPRASAERIAQAQRRLDAATASVQEVSEASHLARMSWWTIEYGMIGSFDRPKIYGAGLLSSVGESYRCFDPEVRKLPLTLDCIEMSYDITRPQPQLYVAPDFETMSRVLEELADRMAFRRGGLESLEKAHRARTVTTTVLESGIQISGILKTIHRDASGQPAYLQFEGPTQLSQADRQLADQGPEHHSNGFGAPIGKLKATGRAPQDLSDAELERLGGRMEFESGVVIQGKPRKRTHSGLIAWDDCTVRFGEKTLFQPEWGPFDLACGAQVVSVFGGAADRRAYLEGTGGYTQLPGSPKTNLTPENQELNGLYAEIRQIRQDCEEKPGTTDRSLAAQARATEIERLLERSYPHDWLLRYELLELASSLGWRAPWQPTVLGRLRSIAGESREKADLISRGLALLPGISL